MAYQNAKGNGPATGMPKTPAPTKPAAPDLISRVRNPQGSGYGSNDGASNPSSVDPGKQLLSPMAENLKASQDDGEGVLDAIIKGGAHAVDMGPHPDVDWQTRRIDPGNVPTHPAMKGASAGPKVPAKIGFTEFNPTSVRKPGE